MTIEEKAELQRLSFKGRLSWKEILVFNRLWEKKEVDDEYTRKHTGR